MLSGMFGLVIEMKFKVLTLEELKAAMEARKPALEAELERLEEMKKVDPDTLRLVINR
jgi:hypothetical protein